MINQVHVYQAGTLQPNGEADVMIYFGPAFLGTQSGPDFSELLKKSHFPGIFIFPENGPDGNTYTKFFEQNNGFDSFCFHIMNQIANLGGPSTVRSLILVSDSSGAEAINGSSR